MNTDASEYVMVYVTTSSRAEADVIANALVEGRLAACVNVFGEIQSTYRWQGKVESATEVSLIAKTRRALFDEVCAKVKSLHSYDVPCIVAYPMVVGDAHFLQWVNAETGGD